MLYLIIITIFILAKHSASAVLYGQECNGEASDAIVNNNYGINYTKFCSSDLHLICDASKPKRRCTCKQDHYPDWITGGNPDGSVCRYVDPGLLDVLDEGEEDYEYLQSISRAQNIFTKYSTLIFSIGLISWILLS